MVFPVGKDIKAAEDTGIITSITEDLAHDRHKDSVKAADIIMVISMVVNDSPQTSLT